MAEIDVVKKSSMMWVWIVVALVVLAIVAWFLLPHGDTARVGFRVGDGVGPGAVAVVAV